MAAETFPETFRFAPPYELPSWPFLPPAELSDPPGTPPRRHAIVIVGAGLAGLTLACDLAQRGVDCVVLDEDDTVGVRGASSRGICYAQKSLEIFERLGIAKRIVGKGAMWSSGRTFSGDDEVYSFELDPARVSMQPPFVNLQQFYLEWFLADRILELGHAQLRWKSRVAHIEPRADAVSVDVDTPAGRYTIEAEHLIDATGANSPIRKQLDVPGHASRSTDRWCISDVRFAKPLPIERWTWIEATFNDDRAVWQHLMADDVWRMDYQMGEDADPETISKPEVAGERLRRQLGPEVEFEFVWIGPYQYRDHLLDRFRDGRVFFVGDSAHVVSPFGARGGNSGIQDAANLGWKLALATQGHAGDALLDSYDAERRPAAVQNLEVTSRTSRFLAPRSKAEHVIRRAALSLAKRHAFARPLVNTGRMSMANPYPAAACAPQGARSLPNVALQRADGSACCVMDLLRDGTRFVALAFGVDAAMQSAIAKRLDGLPVGVVAVCASAKGPHAGPDALVDERGQLAQQLGATEPSVHLLRPDAYIAASIDLRGLDATAAADRVASALRAALGRTALHAPAR